MDSQEDNTAKLTTKSREYVPPVAKAQELAQIAPPESPVQEEVVQEQAYVEMNQFNDPNQTYLQYVNYYLNQGMNTKDAEAWAKYFIDMENYERAQREQAYEEGQYQEQQENYEEEKISSDYYKNDQISDEYGNKTKKPHGERRKEKYQGKHHDQYDGSEEGYYDELGFYYMPDGSFYDPDGYYFNTEGYDKFGGYYDEEANYIASEDFEGHDNFQGKGKHQEAEYQEEGNHEDEEKYTKDYIEYITKSKYYDDLEYLKATQCEWAYLKAGNLAENTIKTNLLKYFGDQGIDTKQITIMMSGGKTNPVGNLEIYKIPVAIQVLKLCGQELNKKQIIIEVDHENEKAYNGVEENYNTYEYEDETDSRYTKFDAKPAEYQEKEVQEAEAVVEDQK